MHDLETAANDARTAKCSAHLVWRGIGRDVVILGRDAGNQVTHRATHDIGFESGRLQRFASAPCAGRNVLTANTMPCDGNQRGRTDNGRITATKYAA